ncbi:MAG: glycoside hydrolase family 3 C-terminal domain-containing protein [Bacteroidota bacterium]
MNMTRGYFILLAAIISGLSAQGQAYKNPKLPVEERVKDLLSRMTIEEKFWQLYMMPGDLEGASPQQYKSGIFGFQVSAVSKGKDATQQMLTYSTTEDPLMLTQKVNSIQRYFVEQTRLGIPIIAFDETLHGLVRGGATAFPQAIGLAATFDTAMMRQVASAIALETKARGIRQVLSPVVNVATDVRWGRVEETYGEDPYLVTEMGVAFVSAFERMNITTTPKHFVANVGDGGRDSYPIHANERYLEEVHFPPFKACFSRGGSRSVMTSYNSLDGTACTGNEWLLNKKLKQQWGFRGFVISDAGATGGTNVLHMTSPNYPTSGRHAIEHGLDVIFQTAYDHHTLFNPPFFNGQIDMASVDAAVARVLRAKFELGLFEDPYVREEAIKKLMAGTPHKPLAKQAALESIVLLKNENNVLPLSKNVKSIAVIGTDAVEARLGGYSGPGNGKVSILDGLKQKAGARTSYAPGPGRESENYVVVPAEHLFHGNNQRGLEASYFNSTDLQGKPALTRIDPQINFHWTLFSPDPEIKPDYYSVRWSGQIQAPVTGNFMLGLEGNDGYRLYVDNKLVVDRWRKQTYSTATTSMAIEKGKLYDIRVEFYESVGNAHIKLIWNVGIKNDWREKISEAVKITDAADVAVVVAGIHEGEFQDRAMLSLPGHQEELISAVAARGKPVVVLLVGGSAITMQNWLDKVDGVVEVWYPGEEGGRAVAEVLWGDYNPAGRLPITFPLHEAQLPLSYYHKPTGRGDDYNNLSGLPLFPFGFGLSYTTFGYRDLRLDKTTIAVNESTIVRCIITNTGTRDGDEVVQLYIRDMLASVARPVMELKGFQRIHLKAGESREVRFAITPAMLSMLNEKMETVVEPGDFRIMIGASSRDLRLKQTVTVQ